MRTPLVVEHRKGVRARHSDERKGAGHADQRAQPAVTVTAASTTAQEARPSESGMSLGTAFNQEGLRLRSRARAVAPTGQISRRSAARRLNDAALGLPSTHRLRAWLR
jgi:hypothetical protein